MPQRRLLTRNARIPDTAVKRLPVYLRVLEDLLSDRIAVVSSAELSARTGFSPEQIRKDLAYFGAFGTRGVGYDSATLSRRIREILGLQGTLHAALVGAGNLGTALARYSLSKYKDVRISAIFDNDPSKVGRQIQGVEISPMGQLPEICRRLGVKIGIIAVPAQEAQNVATALCDAGVEAILNFSPVKLRLPPQVYLQNIDLTMELQALAYYTSGAASAGTPDAASAGARGSGERG